MSEAADCGRSLVLGNVQKLVAAVEIADRNLSQHSTALLRELEGMLARGGGAYGDAAYQSVESENQRVDIVLLAAERLTARLDQIVLLLQVKATMVDQRDRANVSRFISVSASHVGKASRLSLERVNRTLISVSRPGIATDVAKLRDSVSDVLGAFDTCVVPQEPR